MTTSPKGNSNLVFRPSRDRGFADHGWLKSHHSFSFADYHDPRHMGFSILRVINQDRVLGGSGFGTHGHRDMEIVSYVIDGEVEHKDSLGNAARIRPGELQRMTAGTGVRHSEYNPSMEKEAHFLQIWLLPRKSGEVPGYAQKSFIEEFKKEDVVLVGSPDGRKGSITLMQDVYLYACKKAHSSGSLELLLGEGHQVRNAWIQVVRGEVKVEIPRPSEREKSEKASLFDGDGLGVKSITQLNFSWEESCEFLIFDLP